MDRRTMLKGGLVLAATAHTAVASGEVVAKAADPESRLLRFTLPDNHATPFAKSGDTVIYDTGDLTLKSGKTYVTMTDKRQNLYVCRAREDREGHWWAEIYETELWYGPMTKEFFQSKVQGRIKAVWYNII